ncbi:hypothetical protein B0A52_08351 [Exophiala mesophila]|uniref:Altered inheritance of mitochondria protein 24, mitochondrial n=1 Tax=Exophiala mesophila TaxID=212818 RepID=A0A438MW10_EXOME|nr:hypothetical protein B0A52_08351 [Exophiala mesophila]
MAQQYQNHGGYFPPPPDSSQSFPPPPTQPQSQPQFFPPPPSSPPNGVSPSFPPPPAQATPPPLQQPTAKKPYNYSTVPASAPAHRTTFDHKAIASHYRQPSYNGEQQATPVPEYQDEPVQQSMGVTSPRFAKFKGDTSAIVAEVGNMLKGPDERSTIVAGVPRAELFQGAQATTTADDVGTFNGGSYRISHRDTNSVLTIQLAVGCPLIARPGAMIAMSPSVSLRGAVKFSMKKLFIGDMSHSTFTGPGEVLLAPSALGDLSILRLGGQDTWFVGRDAFLCSTQGVIKEYKNQGISKAMFSGEGLFVYRMTGQGLLWVSTFGAILRKDLIDGEKYIIDNNHLVAWNCKYIMERVASGGIVSGFSSGEGLVCKFTGPGTVFMQTRNPNAFNAYITGASTRDL